MNAVVNKQAKGTVDSTKAAIKGLKAKGAALAALCVNFAVEEVKAEEKRGEKRRKYIADIFNLTPEGHSEFRAELQRELMSFDESEKVLVKAGAMAEAESKKAGYSSASFRVMVSNWRTISVACEAGMKPVDEAGAPLAWDATLSMAREVRRASASVGESKAADGMRAQGAGRKAVSDYDKALRLVAKLAHGDLVKMQAALGGLIEASAPKAKKVK